MASPAVAEFVEDTATTPQEDVEEQEENDEEQDVAREGETPEEALQRRIEEGNIGKGKTLRRWKDTEEKQRRVETGRHQSKVQRYGQIYDEVKALRQETRHSVEDLRKRFKDSGVIQNKDQFIVRLIAQERNEQEGKVAAIKSLQQWRLTDVELHNFINRCHRRGIAGKLGLATQWAFEQEEAGGEVNFKEGLAFYSSIGILQPRSSAHTQQQWREWREWEDAMTSALENRKSRGSESAGEGGAEPAGPDASCNEDSTVCNSPWSSERGGGGSFGGFSGNSLRASSTHGEGDVAGGNGSARSRARSGAAPETTKDGARLPRRGRAPANKRDSPAQKTEWWSWRSYSPPSMLMRRKSAETVRKAPSDSSSGRKSSAPLGRSASGVTGGVSAAGAGGGGAGSESGRGGGSNKPFLSSLGSDQQDGSASGGVGPGGGPGGVGSSSSQVGESVVRSSGGYLPPRHPLAALQLSPTNARANGGGSGSDAAGADGTASAGAESGESSGGEGSLVVGAVPGRPRVKARGQARTRAKGPAGGGDAGPPRSPTQRGAIALEQEDDELGPAPTEGEASEVVGRSGGGRGGGGGGGSSKPKRRRRKAADDSGVHRRSRSPPRSRSLSGVLSGLADWLMPGMDGGPSRLLRVESGSELLLDVYPGENPGSPEKPGRPRSAPATPRGRRQTFSVLREGGWFYNGDSDYSTEEENGGGDSDDEGFWADAGATELRAEVGDGGGLSVLKRLRKLFTGL